jgi:glycosyltransferase involved in cell wall biosynthesis
VKQFTILHTIETGGPGGAETVLLNLASQLNKSRFRSIALLPCEGWLSKRLNENGVRTYVVDSKAWYDFHQPLGIARVIRREKVDLIHSHLPGQNFYSCLVGTLTGRKTVATYHGAIELAQARGMRGAIQLGGVRMAADAIIVVCDYMSRMLQQVGFPAEKITRIYNGISPDRFCPDGDGRLKRELQIRNGTKLVGTVANVRQTKGYEFFIQAARQVLDAIPDTRFVAVGDVDPHLAKPLFDSIDRLNLKDRFHFLGFRRDVPELLPELDVFVLPSTSEGFPLVALEAMASARPIVMTRSGGPEEIIEDGRTGLLVPPADSNALAAKICELLQDPNRASELARMARAKIESTFAIDRMIRDYEELYERVLKG